MNIECDLTLQRPGWQAHYVGGCGDANGLALLGQSGSGKTSLLRAVSGLETGVTGKLLVNGCRWVDGQRSLPVARRNLAYVNQDCVLWPHLTVQQHFKLASKNSRLSAGEQLDWLGRAGVLGWLNQKPVTLSGGQRQRIALACALLKTPALLLLDESLSALDGRARQSFLGILQDYQHAQGTPWLLVSHQLDEAAQLCQQAWWIEQGRIHGTGTVNDISRQLSPATGNDMQPGTLLKVRADHYHPQWRLMKVALVGESKTGTAQCLWAPLPEHLLHQSFHLFVPAAEIIVARHPIQHSSLQNCLAATITDITHSETVVNLGLAVDGQALVAHISHRAYATLQPALAQTVYAHIKASRLHH